MEEGIDIHSWEGDSTVPVYMEVRVDMHAVLSQLLFNRQACVDPFS